MKIFKKIIKIFFICLGIIFILFLIFIIYRSLLDMINPPLTRKDSRRISALKTFQALVEGKYDQTQSIYPPVSSDLNMKKEGQIDSMASIVYCLSQDSKIYQICVINLDKKLSKNYDCEDFKKINMNQPFECVPINIPVNACDNLYYCVASN